MNKRKHVMVTCYDATFAKIIADTGAIDSVLVGDSLGMVIQGEDSTLNVTMDQMLYHIAAVARGLERSKQEATPLLIGDMPIHSYSQPRSALKNAQAMLSAGAKMVKVEGPVGDIVEALKENGIAVCGHIGLTPQSIHEYKLQGKTDAEAERLMREAALLDKAQVDLLVLEMIPAPLSKRITEAISVPTIGIGAGPHCSGQVLVLYDLLGFNADFNPKFLKKFMPGSHLISEALIHYSTEVQSSQFPGEHHSFGLKTIDKTIQVYG